MSEASKFLINKKVKVAPIIREGAWLGKGHDGEFMYSGTTFSTSIPLDVMRNQLKEVLTKEEREAFEKELNLNPGTMSFYDKNSDYWARFRVQIDKDGRLLDLSNVKDYISWKILLNSKFIAKSWNERFQSGEYKFALVDEEEETKTRVSKAAIQSKAWRFFGRIEDNPEQMADVLRLYGKKTSSMNVEFLKGEIQKLMEENLNEFINIMEDKYFSTKVLISRAIDARALEYNSKKEICLKGGDVIGRTTGEVVEFLNNPENNDILLKLKAQVEKAKGN